MADSLYPWILQTLTAHDRRHGANLNKVVNTTRRCQLIKFHTYRTEQDPHAVIKGRISDSIHCVDVVFDPVETDRQEELLGDTTSKSLTAHLRHVFLVKAFRYVLAEPDKASILPRLQLYLLSWDVVSGDIHDPVIFEDAVELGSDQDDDRTRSLIKSWYTGLSSPTIAAPDTLSVVRQAVAVGPIQPDTAMPDVRHSMSAPRDLSTFLDPYLAGGSKKPIPEWLFEFPEDQRQTLEDIDFFGLDADEIGTESGGNGAAPENEEPDEQHELNRHDRREVRGHRQASSSLKGKGRATPPLDMDMDELVALADDVENAPTISSQHPPPRSISPWDVHDTHGCDLKSVGTGQRKRSRSSRLSAEERDDRGSDLSGRRSPSPQFQPDDRHSAREATSEEDENIPIKPIVAGRTTRHRPRETFDPLGFISVSKTEGADHAAQSNERPSSPTLNSSPQSPPVIGDSGTRPEQPPNSPPWPSQLSDGVGSDDTSSDNSLVERLPTGSATRSVRHGSPRQALYFSPPPVPSPQHASRKTARRSPERRLVPTHSDHILVDESDKSRDKSGSHSQSQTQSQSQSQGLSPSLPQSQSKYHARSLTRPDVPSRSQIASGGITSKDEMDADLDVPNATPSDADDESSDHEIGPGVELDKAKDHLKASASTPGRVQVDVQPSTKAESGPGDDWHRHSHVSSRVQSPVTATSTKTVRLKSTKHPSVDLHAQTDQQHSFAPTSPVNGSVSTHSVPPQHAVNDDPDPALDTIPPPAPSPPPARYRPQEAILRAQSRPRSSGSFSPVVTASVKRQGALSGTPTGGSLASISTRHMDRALGQPSKCGTSESPSQRVKRQKHDSSVESGLSRSDLGMLLVEEGGIEDLGQPGGFDDTGEDIDSIGILGEKSPTEIKGAASPAIADPWRGLRSFQFKHPGSELSIGDVEAHLQKARVSSARQSLSGNNRG